MSGLVGIYVRVSSKAQDTRSQEGDLERWAQSQNVKVKWYRDKATGTKMDRPAMGRLLEDVASGVVTRIVVWRLDRLGRTAAGLTSLFDDLVRRGVGLFSLKDSLDLETPAGRLMANVLASVASYETEVRRERQTAGIAAARENGVTWGGSKKGRKIKVTPQQEKTVKLLKAQGTGISDIARSVGLSRPTVYGLLEEAGAGK